VRDDAHVPRAALAARTVAGGTVPPFAVRVVLPAAALQVVLLSALSQGYGYHRDELYFRMLRPGWGYFDEGPVTPLLARAFSAISDQPWALRVPATLASAGTVVVVALLARELGGGRAAQAVAAWGFAFAAVPLVFGHTLLTSTVDLPVWPAILLCIVRAVRRGQPRWWLAAGGIAGLSTYNKLLVAVLLVALAAGLLVAGPHRLLRSRHVWAAAVLAAVLAAPNIAYQVAHGWPELTMGRALAADNAGTVHVAMWPFLLIMLGLPLVPIWIAGLVLLWRVRELRFVAAAFPVLLVLVFLMGSQFYYTFGLLAVLFGVGCVPAAEWMRTAARRRLVAAGIVLNALANAVLALPIVPLGALGSTPVPAINQAARDSVGWTAYVRQITAVYEQLPATERAHAVVVTSNYGEAGAVDRYGLRLPRVYSAHNQLYFQARPPDSASTAIVVGGQLDVARPLFASCRVAARLDNGVGVSNEEQGEPVAVCSAPVGGWRAVWPRLRHAG
jgi:4-amino-4-deoxy-L-arabinose transferase-like glycosyltransferase